MQFKITSIAVAAFMLASMSAHADSVKIIVNPSVPANQVSVREIKSVYLREKNSLSDGTRVEPVLEKSGSTHDAFLKLYLKQNNYELQRYYQGLVFTGKGSMPKELGSDDEVVAFVANTKGAIGYVSVNANTPGVKTVAVVDTLNSPQRQLIAFVAASYPEILRQKAIGGIVRLRITVTPKGDVTGIEVLGGNPILNEPAVTAVQQWRFAAGPSPTLMEVSIPFDPH